MRKQQSSKEIIYVNGMTCSGCENTISRALTRLPGVYRVRANAHRGTVEVDFDGISIRKSEIVQAIEKAGYQVGSETAAPNRWRTMDILGFVVIVAVLYLLLNNLTGLYNIPQIEKSMTFGVLFVVGLLTSVHCVAMCGGIVVSQTVRITEEDAPGWKSRIWPSLSYNAGRVASYTIIGGLAGLLGSAVTFSNAARGVVTVAASVLMLILALNMLGLFDWTRKFTLRLPGRLQDRVERLRSGNQPFYVGLANGLMPCGPLQAMQLYALGTGSLIAGATSMLVFAAGTVPLLLGFGVLNTLLSHKYSRGMLKISAVMVTVMALLMFSRGMALSGVSVNPLAFVQPSEAATQVQVEDGVQIVRTVVDEYGYSPAVTNIQKGVPVKWIINAKSLNGCNNPITVPELGIQKQLVPGENIVEFTPKKTGSLAFSCWMGMITGQFNIVDDLRSAPPPSKNAQPTTSPGIGGGCCGATSPRFD